MHFGIHANDGSGHIVVSPPLTIADDADDEEIGKNRAAWVQ